MRKTVLWAACLLALAAPAPAQYSSGNYYPPPPDPVTTKVQGAKQNFDYAVWAAQNRQNEIKAAEKSMGDAQKAKDQGQSKVWRQDGYNWKEVPVDEAIESDQEKIDQKKKEEEEGEAKAEEVAAAYVGSEGEYKDKYGRNYSPDTLSTASAIVERAASRREAARREAEEAARLEELEKKEKLKEEQKGRNEVQIPVVGKGKAVENIEIDPMKMGQRPAESPALLVQAPGTELKGTAPKALPHDLKPVGDQGTVAPIEALPAQRRKSQDPLRADGQPVAAGGGEAAGDPAKAAAAVGSAGRALALGNFQKAVHLADEALRQDPKNVQALLIKSKALGRVRDFYGAEEAARKALELSPDSPEALRALAWALLHSGKYREAEEAASRAIAMDPKDAEAYALRAFAYEKLGDKGRMLDDLRRAAELDRPRFEKLVKKAAAGETVFDPSAEDSWQLLEAVSGSGSGRKVPLAAGAALLAGLVVLWFGWTRARIAKSSAPEASAPEASAPAPPAEPSGVLGGKYEVQEKLGAGAWKAWDPALQRALFVRRSAVSAEQVRSLAALGHPNIEEVYGVLEEKGGLFVLSEWLEGKDLEERLTEGPLGPGVAKTLLEPVCGALMKAHEKGLAHGALSLRKVLLTRHGQVKLVGFGAKADAQASSDLEALRDCVERLLPDYGPAVDKVLAQTKDPDPLKRPQSVAELWKALAPLL